MKRTFTNLFKPILYLVFLLLVSVGTAYAGVTASFSVSDTVGCVPLTIKFTNNSSGASTYYWDFGNGNTSKLTNPSNAYTTPGTYTIKLIAYDASGNADSVIKTNLIRVASDPKADFSAVDTMVCPKISISFTNNSSNSTSWIWDFGDGSSSSTQNPSHAYSASGTYTVKLIAKNKYGCSNALSRSKYILIYSIPVPSFSANVTDACDTSQVFKFTDKSSSPKSWYWDLGDSSTSTSQNPSHIYSKPGAYTIKLTTSNSYGCKGTTTLSNYITIDTITAPLFSASVKKGCVPLTTTLKAPANGKSYNWDFGDGYTGTGQSISHIYKKSGVYKVKLSMVNSKGCTRENTIDSFITVNSGPTVSFSVKNGTACKYDQVQFTNNTTGAVKYVWDFGDGAQSTNQNPTHEYITGGKFSVLLKATNSNGCSSIDTVLNAVNITSPIIRFSADKTNGCNPMTVNFTDSSSNASKYYWDFGDSSTSTSKNPTHKYTSIGNFTVTLIAENSTGCKDTLIKSAYISVNNLPTTYITPTGVKSCAPYSTVFQDPSTGSVSWNWDFGDGSSSTDSTPTHVYKNPGKFQSALTATKVSGCKLVIVNYKTFNIKGATADFALKSTQCPPFVAAFKDSIANVKSWSWDFGDGGTSTLQSPTHTYAKSGYYTVSHTITTKDGCSNTNIQSNIVHFDDFDASFSFVALDSTFPQRVAFTGTANGATSYLWDFGDTTSSTLLSPTHKYKYKKDYDVTLTIMNAKCTLTVAGKIFNVTNPPSGKKGSGGSNNNNNGGGGTVKKNSRILGCAPVSVNFKDTSTTGTSWNWDFGDSGTSTTQNPTHRYTKAGIYDVKVYVKHKSGKTDTTIYKNYVQVNSPIARFNYSQVNTCQNATVKLRDSSSGATSWYWDFGNGDTVSGSTTTTYAYPANGKSYSLTLTVADTLGCTNSVSKNILAGVSTAITASKSSACYSDTVKFKSSLSSYSSYYWSFGDSSHSTAVNPVHKYDSAGTYKVSLLVSDNNGCSRTYKLSNAVIIDRPNVDFTGDTTRGCTSLTVAFDNATIGTHNWYWDFGDGSNSYRRYPTHTYSKPGIYTVSMTAEKNGCSATITKNKYIRIQKPSANFTFSQNTSCFPITLSLTDSSMRAKSWSWDFGNKDTSNKQNPSYIYTKAPAGDVTLSIIDSNGCSAKVTKSALHYLSAKFAAKNTNGCVPWTSTFIDSSVDATTWLWNFGDGDTSHSQSPKHLYKKAGKYDISLVVSNNGQCSDTMNKTEYMKAFKPVADFYTKDKASCAPSYVQFKDSSDDASSWFWDFGDGGNSTLKNPSHIYNKPGWFTVKLKIKNKIGCTDSMIKINYIRVLGPVTSIKAMDSMQCGVVKMHFWDASTGAISWQWNFGDGSSSTDKDPVHLYDNYGSYSVSLITKDSTGCKALYTYPNKIYIYPKPDAAFKSIDTMGCAPYTISYQNESKDAVSYFWSFGDGASSTDESPVHRYDSSGEFKIYMVAKNKQGCTDTMNFGKSLHVNPSPKSEFSVNVDRGCSPLFITFTNKFHSSQKVDFYWDFGNGMTSKEENPQVTFRTPGFYDVHLVTKNNFGCTDTTVKNKMIEVFPTTPPVSSHTLGVSVVSDNAVSISWDSSKVRSFAAYNVFRLNAVTGKYERVEHITNRFTTSYINVTKELNTLYNTYTFKVQTEDMCGNALPLDSLIAHTTINVTAKPLKENVLVGWTPYKGATITRYDIFRTQQGTADTQLVGSTMPDINFILDTGYICPVNYFYKVKAIALDGNPINSWSDTSVAKPENMLNLQKVDIIRSTVVDDSRILTEWKAPEIAPSKVAKYNVYRSKDNISFELAGSVPNYQYSYVDSEVNVHKQNYFYKIIPANYCNIHGGDGEFGNSILLNTNKDRVNEKILISWTPYVKWKEGVDYYIIEKLKDDGTWEVFKQVNGRTLQSEDEK